MRRDELLKRIPVSLRYIFTAITVALLLSCAPMGSASVGPILSRGSSTLGVAASEPNRLLSLMPEARNMAAPAWVSEGLRVYYTAGAATIDNPFRMSQESLPPLPGTVALSPASPALVRTDVIALASRFAATSSTLFMGDTVIPWADASSTGYPGICDFWVNPAAVRELEKKPPKGVRVTTTTFRSTEKTHSATRVDLSSADPNEHFTWLFDSATGLILYQAEWRRLNDARYAYVAVAEYQSMHYVSVPWSGGVAPAWVKPGAKMTYQGTIRTWTPATGPNIPIPAVLNVEIISAGRNWSEAQVQRVLGDKPEDSFMRVHSGTGTLAGGFWVPRASLLKLKAGDQLDRFDPVTGSTVEVGHVGPAAGGKTVVAIFEWGTKYKRVWIYRIEDGMLLYWLDEKVVDPVTGMVQQGEWQITEDAARGQ